MNEHDEALDWQGEVAPGDATAGTGIAASIRGYVIGLLLSLALTGASFALVDTHLIWAPGIPIALATLGVAQMGVHLVFFLHIGTGPDNTNNVLALAFGTLVVMIVVAGSLWIMNHLDRNMMPMDSMMRLEGQP